MFDTIIIPIDLSQAEAAPKMIKLAKALSKPGAKLVLCNVLWNIPEYVAIELPENLGKKAQANAESKLSAIATQAGISADIVVGNGQPANEIIRLAEKRKADLIIVASHKPGLQDFFIGSTASRIVSHAKCNVHVMR
ncbi:MAG: universal stress protein [Rhodospirillales bacterium]